MTTVVSHCPLHFCQQEVSDYGGILLSWSTGRSKVKVNYRASLRELTRAKPSKRAGTCAVDGHVFSCIHTMLASGLHVQLTSLKRSDCADCLSLVPRFNKFGLRLHTWHGVPYNLSVILIHCIFSIYYISSFFFFKALQTFFSITFVTWSFLLAKYHSFK